MTSSASGSAASSRSSAAGSVNVGVPPPRKIVSTPRRERAALQLELGEQRVDVGAVLVAPPDRGDEVAVPAAVRAERQVDVEVADAAHAPSAAAHQLAAQFGQTCSIASAHSTQNVHSNEQIAAGRRLSPSRTARTPRISSATTSSPGRG